MSETVKSVFEVLQKVVTFSLTAKEVHEAVSEFCEEHKVFVGALTLYGAYSVSKMVLSNTYSFYKTFLRPTRDLYNRYQGGYVVVTGATHGLGFEYARQFAHMGFNLVLIARNEGKI